MRIVITVVAVVFLFSISLNSSSIAYASDSEYVGFDLEQLEKNISACDTNIKAQFKAKIFDKYKTDVVRPFYPGPSLAFYFVHDAGTLRGYARSFGPRECTVGLLNDAELLLSTFFKRYSGGIEAPLAKIELASVKFDQASFLEGDFRNSYFIDAEKLIDGYLDDTLVATNRLKFEPYFSASQTYFVASTRINDDSKIALLDKALAILNRWKESDWPKDSLDEQLAATTREMAKHYRCKNTPKFLSTLAESTTTYEKIYKSGHMYAACSIAGNYSMAGESKKAEEWMKLIQENKLNADPVCAYYLNKADPCPR